MKSISEFLFGGCKNLPKWQQIALTMLRVVIGWHFLYEGIAKWMMPDWSSFEYISSSNWIFSGFFQWIAENPGLLQFTDGFIMLSTMAIGFLLILGFMERLACVWGLFLLLMFWIAKPPLTGLDFATMAEGNYLIIDKNTIEFFALIALCALPSGCYYGLNVFFAPKRKENTPASKPEISKNESDFYPCGTPKPKPAATTEEKPKEIVSYLQQPESFPCGGRRETPDNMKEPGTPGMSRRKALKGLATLPVLGAMGIAVNEQRKWESYEEKVLVDANTGASGRALNMGSLKDLKAPVGMAQIKGHNFSRLILGGNLLSGWAHSRDLIYVSQLVKAYHHKDKIFSTLLMAEKCGVNTLLTNPILCSIIDEYWRRNIGHIQFISDCAGLNYDAQGKPYPMDVQEYLDKVKRAIDTGAVACYIQGETADYYMNANKPEVLHKVMDLVRSNGLIVGIGAHRIETVKACVDHGLETDFWMKTLHHHNYWSAQHGGEWHDNIYCFNPDETIAYMKTRPEPLIAFKVMAAGAIRPEDGFRYALENGADFICAGMYDFQMVEDVNIFNEIYNSGITRERPWRA